MNQEQVLDVAERLFGDIGYQTTSLEQIAHGSDFSVGSVHKMFNGKSGLLSAVITRRYNEMRTEIMQIQDRSLPGLDAVLALCAFYLDYYEAHPAVARLHRRVYAAGIEPSPDFAEYRQTAADGNQLFVGPIKAGQREGTIREGRPLWLATIVQGLISFDQSVRYSDDSPASKEAFLSVVRDAISRVDPPPASALSASASARSQ
jgi:AcrR family transcriptional regulator